MLQEHDLNLGKLVRDKIPQIIRERGAEPLVRVAGPDEYRLMLRAKLSEEVDEFLESDNPEELADILEVIRALGDLLGVNPVELEKLRMHKAAERGGFTERILWLGNQTATTAQGLH